MDISLDLGSDWGAVQKSGILQDGFQSALRRGTHSWKPLSATLCSESCQRYKRIRKVCGVGPRLLAQIRANSCTRSMQEPPVFSGKLWVVIIKISMVTTVIIRKMIITVIIVIIVRIVVHRNNI